jgi:sec-independent protein translocase protein TatB
MNIFGVGPLELAVCAVIAIVVLGPERFPQAAVQVARAIKFLRGYATEATSDLRGEFAELTKEYEELRKELDEVRGSVNKQVGAVTGELTKAHGEATAAVRETPVGELRQLMSGAPIIEPGGELPPDRQGSNGVNGTNGASGGPNH